MMREFSVSKQQIRKFDTDGFLIVRDLFSVEEMNLLLQISKSDNEKRIRLVHLTIQKDVKVKHG